MADAAWAKLHQWLQDLEPDDTLRHHEEQFSISLGPYEEVGWITGPTIEAKAFMTKRATGILFQYESQEIGNRIKIVYACGVGD